MKEQNKNGILAFISGICFIISLFLTLKSMSFVPAHGAAGVY